VNVAVIWVEEVTLTFVTDTLDPALTVEPERKPEPFIVTLIAVPTNPWPGLMLWIVGGGGTTWKDVEPTGVVPSEFETVAERVAVPTDSPWTTMLVFWVNVPVGLTIAAGLEIESEIGTVFAEGVTVALIVAVCPTWT